MPVIKVNLELENRKPQMALDLDEQYSNEKTILSYLRSGRYYEPDVSLAVLRIVHEGDTVVDVGANAGFFTVLLATLAGPSGRVISFEPGDHNLSRLRNNIGINALGNVTVVEKPATNEVGKVTFFTNSDDSGGNALWDPAHFPGNVNSQKNPMSQTLSATTLDHELGLMKVPAPKLIKIDTEGAEQRVLEGAMGLIRSRAVPYVIAELHEFGLNRMGCSQRSLRGLMEENGYSTFLLFPDGSLPKFLPPGTELKSAYFLNLLFSTPDAVAACWPAEHYQPKL